MGIDDSATYMKIVNVLVPIYAVIGIGYVAGACAARRRKRLLAHARVLGARQPAAAVRARRLT